MVGNVLPHLGIADPLERGNSQGRVREFWPNSQLKRESYAENGDTRGLVLDMVAQEDAVLAGLRGALAT